MEKVWTLNKSVDKEIEKVRWKMPCIVHQISSNYIPWRSDLGVIGAIVPQVSSRSWAWNLRSVVRWCPQWHGPVSNRRNSNPRLLKGWLLYCRKSMKMIPRCSSGVLGCEVASIADAGFQSTSAKARSSHCPVVLNDRRSVCFCWTHWLQPTYQIGNPCRVFYPDSEPHDLNPMLTSDTKCIASVLHTHPCGEAWHCRTKTLPLANLKAVDKSNAESAISGVLVFQHASQSSY